MPIGRNKRSFRLRASAAGGRPASRAVAPLRAPGGAMVNDKTSAAAERYLTDVHVLEQQLQMTPRPVETLEAPHVGSVEQQRGGPRRGPAAAPAWLRRRRLAAASSRYSAVFA